MQVVQNGGLTPHSLRIEMLITNKLYICTMKHQIKITIEDFKVRIFIIFLHLLNIYYYIKLLLIFEITISNLLI